eukprot:7909537-Pyramimonas_sp.AAC.1
MASTCTTPRASTMNQFTLVPSHCRCFSAVGGPSKFGECIFASSEMYLLLPLNAWRIWSYCFWGPGMFDAKGSSHTTCCARRAGDCPRRSRRRAMERR